MISKERLDEFKRIYKKEFKEDLSDAGALEKATKLLRLVELVYKPITKEDYDKLQKRRKETKNNELVNEAAERYADILIKQTEYEAGKRRKTKR